MNSLETEYATVNEHYHTKNGTMVYVCRLKVKVSTEIFDKLRNTARTIGGYYSTYSRVNGFVFPDPESAGFFCGDIQQILDDEKTNNVPNNTQSNTKAKKSIQTLNTNIMELHQALRNIVNLCGVDILKEQRILNILADFNAYDSMPSIKFILKTVIEEGYMNQLIGKGKWDISCDKLIDTFVSSTGLERTIVQYLFSCVGYALGWFKDEPSLSNGTSNSTSTNIASRSVKSSVSPTHGKRMSKDDMFDYLLSIVEIDPSINAVTGLTINQVSFEIDSSKEFSFICEISGNMKISSCYLNIIFYDKNNRIRKNGNTFVWRDQYNGFEVRTIYIYSPISIANISKCKIFVSQINKG